MNRSHRNESTDQVIGRVFKRSVAVLALLALVIAAGLLLNKTLTQEPAMVEAPVASPVNTQDVVQAPAVVFTDITRDAGIEFSHVNGAYGEKLLPETMGGGVAFLDYDNDGDQDLLLTNSDYWPEHVDADALSPTMALYQNDGTGRFTDVTAVAGLAVPFYGMGAAVGDYDNDGDADIFVTAVGINRLFQNTGGIFEEADAGVGGAGDQWSTSAAFLDIDNDGDLDLFVANYVRWSAQIDREVDFQLTGIGRAYGPPNAFGGTHNYLYRNNGDGKFTDVSEASGIEVSNPATDEPMGKALGVVPVDLDGDGWLDILVANDTVQNFLFINLGDGAFEDRGSHYGVAFDRNGKATGAMGVDAAHFRNDGDLGFAVGNFANEMTSLYVTREAAPPFTDDAIVEGIGPASRLALTFGLFFFDYDLDGRLDLFQANGHLEGDINLVQSSQHYRQPAQLFWNCGIACRAGFLVQPGDANGDLATPLVGRGAAFADVDGDGDPDIVVSQNGGPPLLLRNDQALGHHWLRIKLTGRGANRDAIGARVKVYAGDKILERQVMPSRSYLSQVERVLTFGLGKADSIEKVEVTWPGGDRQSVTAVTIDSQLELTQETAAGGD